MDTLLMALRELKLSAMVQALETQRELPGSYGELGFEERLSLMVEAENLHRKKQPHMPSSTAIANALAGKTGRYPLYP